MLASCPVAIVAACVVLCACAERGAVASPAAARVAEPPLGLLIDPIAVAQADGWRVALVHELGGAALAAVPAALDPCVLRVGGEQRSLLPTLHGGVAGFDVQATPSCDALLGLSVAATADSPAQHAKAIVPLLAADGSPQPSPAVAARIGLLAELSPLLDPVTLRAGDDLPVKLAVDLGNARGVEVAVQYRALGSSTVTCSTTRTTDNAMALVRIAGPGAYALTARVEVGTLEGGHAPATTSLAFVIGGKR